MKLLAVFAVLLLAGCMAPDYSRLIPENKDASIFIQSQQYGTFRIETRVNPLGTNPLPPLTMSTQTVEVVKPMPISFGN
jgi:hypothetical protein